MCEELKQKDEIFNARKKCKKRKRIAVEGKFVFVTKEVLELVEEMKAEIAVKKARKQPGLKKWLGRQDGLVGGKLR